MKGYAQLIEGAFALAFAMMILGTTFDAYQETSDDYVERSKLEDAQSKVNQLQGTVDDKNQRINALEDKNSNLQNQLENWKKNYTELEQENKNLREQLNETQNQQPKLIFPPINIEHPWGVSLAAILGIIIGALSPSSIFGLKGYIELPYPSQKPEKKEEEDTDETEEND